MSEDKITDKQRAFIMKVGTRYHHKIVTDVDALNNLTKIQASSIIDDLLQLEKEELQANGTKEVVKSSGVVLGQAVNIAKDIWLDNHCSPLEDKDNFKLAVKRIHQIIKELEDELVL